MEIITLTKENLQQEHICCAIANNDDCQVAAKKAWLAERLDDGLIFKKLAVRGKCFIEYIPAEKAWLPIEAPGYLHINCFWISGQFKGQGYANRLLAECVKDGKTKGKSGITVLSSKNKLPFLSHPQYLKYKGFITAATYDPYFELLYLPFETNSPKPHFKEMTNNSTEEGFVLYYTHQCPFTAKYVPLIENLAKKMKIPFKTVYLETALAAQSAPAPITSYCLFHKGKYVTNEILSEKKFEKLVTEFGY